VEEFIQELDSFIKWYNEQRIKMRLGGMSPIDYRRSLGLVAHQVQKNVRTPSGSVLDGQWITFMLTIASR
jgi:hypothetical protein